MRRLLFDILWKLPKFAKAAKIMPLSIIKCLEFNYKSHDANSNYVQSGVALWYKFRAEYK